MKQFSFSHLINKIFSGMKKNKIFLQVKKNNQGLSLAELLIAMMVFVVTLLLLSQIYLHIVRTEKIAYVLLNQETNIHYALEIMGRAMRMGNNFIRSGDDEIRFTTYLGGVGVNTGYRLRGGTLEKLRDGSWERIIHPAAEVKIDFLRFIINELPNSQPRITITLRGSSEVYNKKYELKLQTSLTPRILKF